MLISTPTPIDIDEDFNISQVNIDDLIVFVVEEMGAEVTGNIVSSWDIDSNILDAKIDSGSFRGDDAVDIEVVIYMNDTGDLVRLYAKAMLVPGNVSITANIVPADVSDARKQIIKKAYYVADAYNKIASSNSSDEVALVMLEALGYDQIQSLSTAWNEKALELTINFSDALLNGEIISDAQTSVSVGPDGDISSFSIDRTENGMVVNQGLDTLDSIDKFVYQVVNHAVHDIYNYELAINHTSFLTNNITINLCQQDTETCVDLPVDNGQLLHVGDSYSFDSVKIETSNSYIQDINITDAIDTLRHIVNLASFDAGSTKYHAADVNNDNNINITDAILILRHIVHLETIDSFDLIDEEGDRMSQLDASHASSETTEWLIVANGDVNLSGGFVDDYIIQPELL